MPSDRIVTTRAEALADAAVQLWRRATDLTELNRQAPAACLAGIARHARAGRLGPGRGRARGGRIESGRPRVA